MRAIDAMRKACYEELADIIKTAGGLPIMEEVIARGAELAAKKGRAGAVKATSQRIGDRVKLLSRMRDIQAAQRSGVTRAPGRLAQRRAAAGTVGGTPSVRTRVAGRQGEARAGKSKTMKRVGVGLGVTGLAGGAYLAGAGRGAETPVPGVDSGFGVQ